MRLTAPGQGQVRPARHLLNHRLRSRPGFNCGALPRSREGKSLVFAGKVGTGFSRKSAHALRQLLDVIATDKPPVTLPMRKPKAVWVKPGYEAEIAYRGL